MMREKKHRWHGGTCASRLVIFARTQMVARAPYCRRPGCWHSLPCWLVLHSLALCTYMLPHNLAHYTPMLVRLIAIGTSTNSACTRVDAARACAQECAALGIAGHDVPAEVAGLQAELPALLRAAAEQVQAGALDAAMRYYADFLAYTAPPEAAADAEEGAAGGAFNPAAGALPPDLLPALQEVRRVELGDPAADAAAALGPGLGSGLGSGGGAAADIDWDLGAGEEDSAATAIDWDAPVAPDPSGGESTADSAPMEVAWDVDASGDEPAGGGAALADAGAEPRGRGEDAGDEAEGGPAGVDWDIGVAAAGEQAPQHSAAGAGAPDAPGARLQGLALTSKPMHGQTYTRPSESAYWMFGAAARTLRGRLGHSKPHDLALVKGACCTGIPVWMQPG